LYDKIGFKKIFLGLMAINILNSLICYPARKYKWLFFASIQVCYLVNSGVFSTFPLPVVKTFGSKHGPRVYAIVMLSNAAGAILNLVIVSISESGLVPIQAIFGTCTLASIIAFVICLRFDERIDSKEMKEMED
jgi:MFS family permease